MLRSAASGVGRRGLGEVRRRVRRFTVSSAVWVTRVRIPAHGLDLDVRASPADQEQDLAVRYWEGAIDVYAAASDSRIGRGYIELTGYRLPPANKPR